MIQSLLVLAHFAVSAAPAGEVPTLDKLLPLMRENAALYANIETRYSRRVVSPQPTLGPNEDPEHVTRWLHETYHAVWQGSLYYSKYSTEFETYAGTKRAFKTEYGYDDEFTRSNYQGQIGNIDDQRRNPYPWFPPQHLGMPDLGEHGLADFLQLSPSVKLDARLNGISRIDSEIVGTEKYDDLECIKIKSDAYVTGDEKLRSRYFFWIAPHRNYLLVRSEQYLAPSSLEVPFVEYTTSDWREVAAGIWLPFRGSCTLRQVANEKSPKDWDITTTTTFNVDSVRLNPKYPTEFFGNIEMPRDKPVYILRGGDIVEERVNGLVVDRASTINSGWMRFGFLIASVVFVVVVAGLLVWRRHVRKTAANVT